MCFYCDREIKGNPQPWWYENYVCWKCCIQNGVKKDYSFLGTKKQIRSNKLKNKYLKIMGNFKEEENKQNQPINKGRICYKCHNKMVDVGFKFKTPKKYDTKKWKHLEKTWENQYIYKNGIKTYIGPENRKVKQSF